MTNKSKFSQIGRVDVTSARGLQQFTNQVKTILNTMTGTSVDAVITRRENTDLVKKVAGFGKIADQLANVGIGDVQRPTKPTGVTGVASLSYVVITWDVPKYRGHANTRVYFNTVDDYKTAKHIGSAVSPIFSRPVDFGSDGFYWVRHVNAAGFEGDPHDIDGLYVKTQDNPEQLLNLLSEAVSNDRFLSAELLSRIDLLDTTDINGHAGLVGALAELDSALQLLTDTTTQGDELLNAAVGQLDDALNAVELLVDQHKQLLDDGFIAVDNSLAEIDAIVAANKLAQDEAFTQVDHAHNLLELTVNDNKQAQDDAFLQLNNAQTALSKTVADNKLQQEQAAAQLSAAQNALSQTVSDNKQLQDDAAALLDSSVTQLNTAKSQIDSLLSDSAAVGARVTELEAVTSDSVTRLDAIEVDNGTTKSRVATLETVTDDTASRLSSLGVYAENSFAVIDELQRVDNEQAQLLTTLRTDTDSQQTSISELLSTTATQATKLTALETQDGTHTSAISSLQTTTASQATQLTGLRTDVDDNAASVTELVQTTESQATRLATLETTDGTHTSAISSLQSTTANQATLLTGLRTDVNDNAASVTELYETTASQATKLTALETQDGTHTSAISSLQTTTASQATQLTGLRTDVDDNAASVTELVQTTESQATRLATLETTDGTHTSAISSLQSTTANQATLLTGLRTDVNGHTSSIQNLSQTTLDQANRLSTLETTDSTHSSSISTLQTTTANQATQLSNLRTDVNGNAASIGTLETTTSTHASRLSSVENAAAANTSKVAVLENASATQAERIEQVSLTSNNLVSLGVFSDKSGRGDWSHGSVVNVFDEGLPKLTGRSHVLRLTQRDCYDYASLIPITAGEVIYLSAWVYTGRVGLDIGRIGIGYRGFLQNEAQSVWHTNLHVNAVNYIDEWVYLQGSIVVRDGIDGIQPFIQMNGYGDYGQFYVSDIVYSRTPNAGAMAAVEDSARVNMDEIGNIKAERVMKVQANGVVAGFGLVADEVAGSRIYLSADNVSIVPPNWNPSDSELALLPFTYSAEHNRIVMNQASIVDLTANKIVGGNLAIDSFTCATDDFNVLGGTVKEYMLDPAFTEGIVRVDPNAEKLGGSRTNSKSDLSVGFTLPLGVLKSGGSVQTFNISIASRRFQGSATPTRVKVEVLQNGSPMVLNAAGDKYIWAEANLSSEPYPDQHLSETRLGFKHDFVLSNPTQNTEYIYSLRISSPSGWQDVLASATASFSVSEPVKSSGGFISDVRWSDVTNQPSFVGLDTSGSASYPRMVAANNPTSNSAWIRVPSSNGGLLPYANGVSNLGTSSWRFNQVHALNFFENGQSLGTKYLMKSETAANANSLGGVAAANYVRSNVGDVLNGNYTIYGTADNSTLKVLKNVDSPDEPAALLIATDGDQLDDLALEIRGNVTGVSVDTSTTVSSPDTTFAVFSSGETVIGYPSLGASFTMPKGSMLAVNGAIDATGNIYAGGRFQLKDLSFAENTDKSLRLTNANGYIDIAPKNTTHAHIYTDRTSFYFNKELLVLGNKVWNEGNDSALVKYLDVLSYDDLTAAQWGGALHYSAFVRPTSEGAENRGGYWQVTGRRDYNDGYAGIFIQGHNSADSGFYIGRSGDGSAPTWEQVWTNKTDGAGSGLNADMVDGAQLDDLVTKAGNSFISGQLVFTSSQFPITTKTLRFNNTEADGQYYTEDTGLVAFDENYFSDTGYGTSPESPYGTFENNGGGLLVKNEDGWGAVLTSQNTRWANSNFRGLSVNNNRVFHLGFMGAGTGLDADLIDNIDSSMLAKLGVTDQVANQYLYLHRNADNAAFYVNQIGGGDIARFMNGSLVGDTSSNTQITFTNDARVNASGGFQTKSDIMIQNPNNGAATSSFKFYDDRAMIRVGGYGAGSSNGFELRGLADAYMLRSTMSGLWVTDALHEVWHRGNHGANSGLSAQYVGGYEQTAFGKLNEQRTWSAGQNFNGGFTAGYGLSEVFFKGGVTGISGTANARFLLAPRKTDLSDWNWQREFGFDTDRDAWYFDNTPMVGTARIFHEDNDGVGSGMNADLLDNKHGSAYLTRDFDSNGDYSTSGDLISGRGSGGVALTINDGKGNANVTFNHRNGVPEQNGNAHRIEANTDDSTNAHFSFEVLSGVTGGESVNLKPVVRMAEDSTTIYTPLIVTAGNGLGAIQSAGAVQTDTRFISENPAGTGGLVGSFKLHGSGVDQIIWTIGTDWVAHSNHYGLGYHYGSEILGTTGEHQITFKNNGSVNARIGLAGNAWFKGSLSAVTLRENGINIADKYLSVNDLSYNSPQTWAAAFTAADEFRQWVTSGSADTSGYATVTDSIATGFVNSIIGQFNTVVSNNANIGYLTARSIEVTGRQKLINNVSGSGHADGWYKTPASALTSGDVTPLDDSLISQLLAVNGNQVKTLRVENTGNMAYSHAPVEVDHNAIYEVSFMLYVGGTTKAGRRLVGYKFSDNKDAVVQAMAVDTYNGETRALKKADNADVYTFVSDEWNNRRQITTYLVGANRSIDEVPDTNYDIVKLNTDVNYFWLRILNWDNETNKTVVHIYNPSVREVNTGKIVSHNILANAITSQHLSANSVTSNAIQAGTIDVAHLKSGIIDTDKLAANSVWASKIASDAIETRHLKSSIILTEHLSSGSVDTNSLAAKSVQAGKIASDAIETRHLKSASVVTDSLAAGAVTASKMVVAPENTYPDYEMVDDDFYHIADGNCSYTLVATAYDHFGQNRMRIPTLSSNDNNIRSEWFAVDANAEYHIDLGAFIEASGGSLRIHYQTAQLDNAGGITGAVTTQITTVTSTSPSFRVKHTIKVPVNHRRFRFIFVANKNTSLIQTSVGGIRMRKRFGGELVVDGSIEAHHIKAGSIETQHIKTLSIEAKHIKTGSITAEKIDVGSIDIESLGWSYGSFGNTAVEEFEEGTRTLNTNFALTRWANDTANMLIRGGALSYGQAAVGLAIEHDTDDAIAGHSSTSYLRKALSIKARNGKGIYVRSEGTYSGSAATFHKAGSLNDAAVLIHNSYSLNAPALIVTQGYSSFPNMKIGYSANQDTASFSLDVRDESYFNIPSGSANQNKVAIHAVHGQWQSGVASAAAIQVEGKSEFAGVLEVAPYLYNPQDYHEARIELKAANGHIARTFWRNNDHKYGMYAHNSSGQLGTRMQWDGAGGNWTFFNSTSMYINTSYGYVRVGAQNSTYAHFMTDRERFYFDKPVYMKGDATFFYSDQRLKTVKSELDPSVSLANIMKWRPVKYVGNEVAASQGFDTEQQQIGLLAQDVEKAYPELTPLAPFDAEEEGKSKSGEHYKTLKYERTVAVLVSALQGEVNERLKLEHRVKELEEQLSRIESMLARAA